VPGVDQVRIKEDETNVLRPDAGHAAAEWKHPCHYLWRGPMYVKWNGDVYPCCQSYMLDGAPLGNLAEQSLDSLWNSARCGACASCTLSGRAGEIGICSRCCTTIPHPVLVAGSLLLHGRDGTAAAAVWSSGWSISRLPKRWLNPPKRVQKDDFVQITGASPKSR
jgi:radical SAM protein with 4Fe4S-binding SPASM domain